MQPHSPTLQYDFKLFDHNTGNANGANPHHRSASDFGYQGLAASTSHGTQPTASFVFGNEHTHLNGSVGINQHSSPGNHNASNSWSNNTRFLHTQFQSPQSMSRRSESIASDGPIMSSTFMQSPLGTNMEYDAGMGHQEPHSSKYPPYQSRFAGSEEAKQYRRVATRFGRLPYIDPASDPSIAEVEFARDTHVGEIYNAMVSGYMARDNKGSISRKRWIDGTANYGYSAECIESIAHKIFDALLDQVKLGFRGWSHSDYVADERKGDDIDKEVDCIGRLGNIIEGLKVEKTVCEDVMGSAAQIRMFVNAPRAYASRKDQNRKGNKKRAGVRESSVPVGRSGKSRKAARRSSRTAAANSSFNQQVQFPLPPSSIPYNSPHLTSNPIMIPRSNPMHRINTLSPHTPEEHPPQFNSRYPLSPLHGLPAPRSFTSHMATMPNLHDPFMTPVPQNINHHFSVPNTPEDVHSARSGVRMLSLDNTDLSLMHNHQAVDPALDSWNFADQSFSPQSAASNLDSEGVFGFDGVDEEDVRSSIESGDDHKLH